MIVRYLALALYLLVLDMVTSARLKKSVPLVGPPLVLALLMAMSILL
jgi:hypothetical protein